VTVSTLRFEQFDLDLRTRELRVGGEPASLGARAFDLLVALMESPSEVRSSRQLMERVWPGLVVEDNNLQQQIHSLRRVLGRDSIRTVPGRGYSLTARPLANPRTSAAPPSGRAWRPAVAVMPMAQLSSSAEHPYMANAVAQDIASCLSKHRWLLVISHNSTAGYHVHGLEPQRTGSELGADYLVRGGVQREGRRLRVRIELVDAPTGATLWADHYDRAIADMFKLQDEIAAAIAARLESEIGLAERQKVRRRPWTDLTTWERFHLGVFHFYRFSAQDNARARDLFQNCRYTDPSFADAHAWWAYAVVLGMIYWDTVPQQPLLDRALEATQRAIELDDQNATFYFLKARVQLARADYECARRECEIAIELNPTLAAAHCGLGDTLAYMGYFKEAIRRFEHALQLSPRDPQRWAFLTYGALAMIFNCNYERAVTWLDQALELPNCQLWTRAHRVVALAHLGRQAEAAEQARQLRACDSRFDLAFTREKLFYVRDPKRRHYLDGLEKAGVE
jgi:adenylate cyclase